MAILYKKSVAIFDDVVSVEEAEGLLEWMQKMPKGKIDLAACTHLHAANLQVLMAAGKAISVWLQDDGLKTWLLAAMKS
jgi:hypothetical protein